MRCFFCILSSITIVIFVSYVVMMREWSSASNTPIASVGGRAALLQIKENGSRQLAPQTENTELKKNSKPAVNKKVDQSYETKMIKKQNHAVELKFPMDRNAKELILLISTQGRSGSSWVGKLLSNSNKDLLYIFEPLKFLQDLYKKPLTPAIETEVLSMVFFCNSTDKFAKYIEHWGIRSHKFPDSCNGATCFRPEKLNNRCRKAKTIVIKTIRLPLENVEHLMEDPQFQHLKVIYLSRDPRAQLASRIKVRHGLGKNPSTMCLPVESDVLAFHRLSQLHPGRFYFLRYEDLCRRPKGEASLLWRFLRSDPEATVPEAWVEYLSSHDDKREVKHDSHSTVRNTSSQWYKWRHEKHIANETLLRAVETHCLGAMYHLGYIPLQTVENVKNFSMSSIGNYSCDFWNCWTHRFY